MSMLRLALGADHAGYRLKDVLSEHLRLLGHEVLDLGTNSPDSVDYPDFGRAVAQAVTTGSADLGVAVCGSGLGIAIAANKVPGARAATCHDVTSARLARLHNDANVLCLGERLIGAEVARDAVEAFISTAFEGGRHANRVAKFAIIEADYAPRAIFADSAAHTL